MRAEQILRGGVHLFHIERHPQIVGIIVHERVLPAVEKIAVFPLVRGEPRMEIVSHFAKRMNHDLRRRDGI